MYDDVAAGGICAAVGFGRDGYGNVNYIIQDFYPRDGDGKRESRIRDDRGFPAGADAIERFSVVRIANNITELRFGGSSTSKRSAGIPLSWSRALRLLGIKSVALPLPVSSSCFGLS